MRSTLQKNVESLVSVTKKFNTNHATVSEKQTPNHVSSLSEIISITTKNFEAQNS